MEDIRPSIGHHGRHSTIRQSRRDLKIYGGGEIQNGPLRERTSYLGTDNVARMTAHDGTSLVVGYTEVKIPELVLSE